MLNVKVKGGALYIALIISIVIGITLSIFILLGFYNQKQVLSQISRQQLSIHLNSALQIAQSEYFSEDENNEWVSIGSEQDSVRIKKLQWGAYKLISTEAKNNRYYTKRCGLFGVSLPKDTALLICETGRPINLAGKIKLNGICYFPKAGYKPAFIEGQSFNSESPIYSLLKPSPSKITSLKPGFITDTKYCLSEFNPKTDSIVDMLPQSIYNNFSSKTCIYHANSIRLQENNLKGNLKLIANDNITIEKNNNLENILLIGSVIRIKKGFAGTLNIIASDSVIIEEDCTLNYPSSILVINDKPNNSQKRLIVAHPNCKIYGSLICANFSREENSFNEMIILNKNCEVFGLVYSSGYAQLQGSVFGTALCSKLIVISPSSVYENHMMNCEIDPQKYGNSLVVAGIFENQSLIKCCKWL